MNKAAEPGPAKRRSPKVLIMVMANAERPTITSERRIMAILVPVSHRGCPAGTPLLIKLLMCIFFSGVYLVSDGPESGCDVNSSRLPKIRSACGRRDFGP